MESPEKKIYVPFRNVEKAKKVILVQSVPIMLDKILAITPYETIQLDTKNIVYRLSITLLNGYIKNFKFEKEEERERVINEYLKNE